MESMKWATETTTTLYMPEMNPKRRKRIAGPPLPEDPAERIEQVRKFTRDLSNLYDHDHTDVYNSVFFTRVGEIMVDTVFDDTTAGIRDLGREILDTRSTRVKLYIAFFSAILGYLDAL
jgi:hypothetical protein